jgi:hypothetical protein
MESTLNQEERSMRKTLTTFVAVAFVSGTLLAQTTRDSGMNYDTSYGERELNLDVFGNYTFDGNTPFDNRLGGGLGVTYFLNRNLGIGGETYYTDDNGLKPDAANASVVFRWPIDDTALAPYVFGGGGRMWEPLNQWTAHAGGGLEMRFTPQFSVFGDARYVLADDTDNFGMARAGVRFRF